MLVTIWCDFVVGFYVLSVALGTATSGPNSDLGCSAHCKDPKKLSRECTRYQDTPKRSHNTTNLGRAKSTEKISPNSKSTNFPRQKRHCTESKVLLGLTKVQPLSACPPLAL